MTRDEAIAYIAAAGGHDDRLRRKAEVFHILYGGNPPTPKGVSSNDAVGNDG